jgi:hypothetical protein
MGPVENRPYDTETDFGARGQVDNLSYGVEKIALAATPGKKEDVLCRGMFLFLRPGGRRMNTHTCPCQTLFDELKPGDRIEVEHMVTVGRRSWPSRTLGTVVRTERRHHELHPHGHPHRARASNSILLELSDGELTTVAVDDSTLLRRA